MYILHYYRMSLYDIIFYLFQNKWSVLFGRRIDRDVFNITQCYWGIHFIEAFYHRFHGIFTARYLLRFVKTSIIVRYKPYNMVPEALFTDFWYENTSTQTFYFVSTLANFLSFTSTATAFESLELIIAEVNTILCWRLSGANNGMWSKNCIAHFENS